MGPRSFFGRAPRARDGSELLEPGWLRPAWLERQLDPGSASFVPQGRFRGVHNLVDRSWTGIGNIGSPHRVVVDARGLVTPRPGGWSLDWWIGAEDRWHFPSREATVRQGLVGTAPVIETLLRVPGGDAVCRAYCVVGPAGVGDLAIVEIENRSAVPFAVGFAIRPYNYEGTAPVGSIELGDDETVRVDGLPALFLPRAPAGGAGSTRARGDVAASIGADILSEPFAAVRCPDGLAQAVFVFALSHTSSIRVGLPLAPTADSQRPEGGALPGARDVARAWDAQTRRGARVVLPPGRIADAFEANRKHLLLAFTGDDVVTGPVATGPASLPDAAPLLRAFDVLGFRAEVRDVITGAIAGPTAAGDFGIDDDDPAANGAAMAVIAAHWRLTRDPELPAIVHDAVALAGRAIGRSRRSGSARRRQGGAELTGLVRAKAEPRFAYADDFWAGRGLLDGAELLQAAGDDRAGAALTAEAEGLEKDLRSSLAAEVTRTGSEAIPARPGGRPDTAAGEGLLACTLGLLAPEDPRITATLDAVRTGSGAGAAVVDSAGHTGLSPAGTLRVAMVEVARGDRRALDRLRWLLEVASDTFAWPESVHPAHRGGTAGDGQDLRVAAGVVLLIRSLLVRELPSRELALFPMLPPEWAGQGLEVHDAPTDVGPASFALRWHGARPALLWDIAVHPGLGPVTLRAPALDPTWSTTVPKGEALLSASEGFVGAAGRVES
ncbi:MAG: hypothetical protein NVS1B12_01780 [Acidimicrobiales bacterium]